MTKSIQQIKQELTDLETAVTATAVEFQAKYHNYLNQLSQSVKQQLILASYQICTQFYPQSFLDLPLSHKQQLQQTLRQIGNEVEPMLLNILAEEELEPEPNDLNLMAELIKNLPTSKRKKKNQEETKIEEEVEAVEAVDLESIKAELANLENIEFIEIASSQEDDLSELSSEAETPKKQKIELNNPEHLVLWHKQIERKIKQKLDRISKQVNQSLQSSQIIPARIPSKIIDVAIQSDSNKGARNNRKPQNAPNVLHLAIETERAKNSSLTHISLLRLRLAEIEFADPLLNAQRSQIRNLMHQISKLNGRYQAVKHQSAIAEAQAAWRSSWYED